MPWIEFQLNAGLSEQHKRTRLSKSVVLLRKFTVQGWEYSLMLEHLPSRYRTWLCPQENTHTHAHISILSQLGNKDWVLQGFTTQTSSLQPGLLASSIPLTGQSLQLRPDSPSFAPIPFPASAWAFSSAPMARTHLQPKWHLDFKIPLVASKALLEGCVHLYSSFIPLTSPLKSGWISHTWFVCFQHPSQCLVFVWYTLKNTSENQLTLCFFSLQKRWLWRRRLLVPRTQSDNHVTKICSNFSHLATPRWLQWRNTQL